MFREFAHSEAVFWTEDVDEDSKLYTTTHQDEGTNEEEEEEEGWRREKEGCSYVSSSTTVKTHLSLHMFGL